MKRKQQPKRQRLGERGEGRFRGDAETATDSHEPDLWHQGGLRSGGGGAVMVREAGGFLERDRPMARGAAVASCKQAHDPLLFPDLQATGR